MNNEIEKPDNGTVGSGGPPPLRLTTLKSSKTSFARVIKAYAEGTLDEKTYRNLVWALGVFIAYLKAESEQEIIKRIEALEEVMKCNR